MNFIRHYFHEIYSVIIILFLTLSAIFLTPDVTQKFVLAFATLYLLHEWEETVYPGGFFNVLFGEIINLQPVPSGERLLNARVYVYLMLLIFTFVPFFLHQHIWLILPFVYLSFLEGFAHTQFPRIFRLERKVIPGWVTAVCQFILGLYALYYLIVNHLVNPWLYLVGFLIFIGSFFMMGRCGMAANGVNFKEVPGKVKATYRLRRASKE